MYLITLVLFLTIIRINYYQNSEKNAMQSSPFFLFFLDHINHTEKYVPYIKPQKKSKRLDDMHKRKFVSLF